MGHLLRTSNGLGEIFVSPFLNIPNVPNKINPLNANRTKWSKTLKQFVSN